MTERQVSLVDAPAGCAAWLAELKARSQTTQQRAAPRTVLPSMEQIKMEQIKMEMGEP